jgi:hypothetical protein
MDESNTMAVNIWLKRFVCQVFGDPERPSKHRTTMKMPRKTHGIHSSHYKYTETSIYTRFSSNDMKDFCSVNGLLFKGGVVSFQGTMPLYLLVDPIMGMAVPFQ